MTYKTPLFTKAEGARMITFTGAGRDFGTGSDIKEMTDPEA